MQAHSEGADMGMAKRYRQQRWAGMALGALWLLGLASCNKNDAAAPAESLHASLGQVTLTVSAPVTHYAAARFADQVSFGATPALVADIERLGFGPWIDAQFALPVSTIDTAPIRHYDSQIPEQGNNASVYATRQLWIAMLASPDQLRRRVTWSLSQFLVTAIGKVEPYGTLTYVDFLQRHAFGNYGDIVQGLTTSPSMANYLDNQQNRPTSTDCPSCAPNENYARELLQLFTLGTVKLNADGSVQRDANNRPAETYTQKDVTELARVLTGWRVAGDYERTDYTRYDGVMVPDPWRAAHDRDAKTVLGRNFGAGQEADAELSALTTLLMAHQNIAPFVSLRLIQHLVTSNPSPAYISRIAAVFRNNGQGVAGDMKAIVKAVLLDPDARRGDVPGADSTSFGKLREPVLFHTAFLRGLGCVVPLNWNPPPDPNFVTPGGQRIFDPGTVFSFYAATDRAPGSNLLAPEQRLLNANEFAFRLGSLGSQVARAGANCNAAPFGRAFSSSPGAFADLVGERYFRSAMPPVLRQNLVDLAGQAYGATPDEKAISLLQYALSTPYFGAIR
jgi:uncharacterized protein (DUF1800 family)